MKKSLLTAAVGLAIATAPMAHADNPVSDPSACGIKASC
jgi:hypothetical protein